MITGENMLSKAPRRIYFDNAATTKMDPRVGRILCDQMEHNFGNPASMHWFGQKSAAALAVARRSLADFFYCQPEELVFTSGATEANNLALKGLMGAFDKTTHFITSAIEHPSVSMTASALQRQGHELTVVRPDKQGVVSADSLLATVTDKTRLISLMYVNNETGVIQPVQEVGKKLEILNEERLRNKRPKIFLHVDAVQALNFLNCRPDHLHADLITFSAHKIHGPKGIGLLYVRDKTDLNKHIDGGTQERGRRAGTVNTAAAMAMAEAVKIINTSQTIFNEHLEKCRRQLDESLKKIKNIHFYSNPDKCVPAIMNFYIDGLSGEDLMIKLDLHGIAVSTGAACAAGAMQPSKTLLAMGYDEREVHGSIRLSLSRYTSLAEIKKFTQVINKIVNG
ncbi:MAG: cysteine desulfurase [Candidatus Komeilibacteria bacterium]|nr:cysteine desulfurase [Candidatus Komeilibacteria bacterium]